MEKMPAIALMIYEVLLKRIADIGAFDVLERKTCLHLSNGFAFVGIHPKKSSLDVNIVSSEQISDRRIIKTEQVSKNRWHNLFRLTKIDDINDQLLVYVKNAYELKKK